MLYKQMLVGYKFSDGVHVHVYIYTKRRQRIHMTGWIVCGASYIMTSTNSAGLIKTIILDHDLGLGATEAELLALPASFCCRTQTNADTIHRFHNVTPAHIITAGQVLRGLWNTSQATPAAAIEDILAASGCQIRGWQRDNATEIPKIPNPLLQLPNITLQWQDAPLPCDDYADMLRNIPLGQGRIIKSNLGNYFSGATTLPSVVQYINGAFLGQFTLLMHSGWDTCNPIGGWTPDAQWLLRFPWLGAEPPAGQTRADTVAAFLYSGTAHSNSYPVSVEQQGEAYIGFFRLNTPYGNAIGVRNVAFTMGHWSEESPVHLEYGADQATSSVAVKYPWVGGLPCPLDDAALLLRDTSVPAFVALHNFDLGGIPDHIEATTTGGVFAVFNIPWTLNTNLTAWYPASSTYQYDATDNTVAIQWEGISDHHFSAHILYPVSFWYDGAVYYEQQPVTLQDGTLGRTGWFSLDNPSVDKTATDLIGRHWDPATLTEDADATDLGDLVFRLTWDDAALLPCPAAQRHTLLEDVDVPYAQLSGWDTTWHIRTTEVDPSTLELKIYVKGEMDPQLPGWDVCGDGAWYTDDNGNVKIPWSGSVLPRGGYRACIIYNATFWYDGRMHFTTPSAVEQDSSSTVYGVFSLTDPEPSPNIGPGAVCAGSGWGVCPTDMPQLHRIPDYDTFVYRCKWHGPIPTSSDPTQRAEFLAHAWQPVPNEKSHLVVDPYMEFSVPSVVHDNINGGWRCRDDTFADDSAVVYQWDGDLPPEGRMALGLYPATIFRNGILQTKLLFELGRNSNPPLLAAFDVPAVSPVVVTDAMKQAWDADKVGSWALLAQGEEVTDDGQWLYTFEWQPGTLCMSQADRMLLMDHTMPSFTDPLGNNVDVAALQGERQDNNRLRYTVPAVVDPDLDGGWQPCAATFAAHGDAKVKIEWTGSLPYGGYRGTIIYPTSFWYNETGYTNVTPVEVADGWGAFDVSVGTSATAMDVLSNSTCSDAAWDMSSAEITTEGKVTLDWVGGSPTPANDLAKFAMRIPLHVSNIKTTESSTLMPSKMVDTTGFFELADTNSVTLSLTPEGNEHAYTLKFAENTVEIYSRRIPTTTDKETAKKETSADTGWILPVSIAGAVVAVGGGIGVGYVAYTKLHTNKRRRT